MKSLYALFVCFFSLTSFQSLAEDLDGASMFADNFDDPFFAAPLNFDNSAEPQSLDTPIFDDTILGSSTLGNGENWFSPSTGSDGSTDLAFVPSTSTLDSIPAASDSLDLTQDFNSQVFFSYLDYWTD